MMKINLKDAAWKEEALKVHTLLEDELSRGLDRVWVRTMGYQRALQVIEKLNALIDSEATEGAYDRRQAELLELCEELQIKNQVIQKIRKALGRECFFIASFFNRDRGALSE